MKRLNLLWMFALLLMSFSFASVVCYTDVECSFKTIVYNTSEYYYNGTVTNSLVDDDTYLYLDQDMTQIVQDNTKIYYTYNYTFNESGTYIRESKANNKIQNEQITVLDISSEDIAGLTMSNSLSIGLVALLIIGGIIMFLVVKK